MEQITHGLLRAGVLRKTMLAGAAMLLVGSVHAADIKIGFNVPLTGFAAADGNSALMGAALAVDQVNAGLSLELRE